VGGVLVVRTLFLVASLSLATGAASRLGTIEVAAHQIVLQLWFLLAMLADSLAIAAQALVAEAAGGGRWEQARDLSNRLHGWGVAVGVILGLGLATSLGPLSGVFTSDPAVRAEVVEAGRVAAVMQPLAATVFVADGVFLAVVRLRRLAASTAAGFVVVAAGVTVATGLAGVWWALVGMITARGLVLGLGYRRALRPPTPTRGPLSPGVTG
jgi:Na+-driven multidrug efflux pump